jgi:hypothetical protein
LGREKGGRGEKRHGINEILRTMEQPEMKRESGEDRRRSTGEFDHDFEENGQARWSVGNLGEKKTDGETIGRKLIKKKNGIKSRRNKKVRQSFGEMGGALNL